VSRSDRLVTGTTKVLYSSSAVRTGRNEAGVAVEHRRFTGEIHGFLGRIDLPGSADGFSYIAGGVDRCLERQRGALT